MSDSSKHIEEELLVRFITGETNASESEKVSVWIGLSEENERRFNQIRKVWEATEEPAKGPAAAVDVDLAWNSLKSRIAEAQEIEARHQGKSRSLYYYISRIAAVFFIGILLYFVYQYQIAEVKTIELSAADTTSTGNRLPDGTLIALNANTTIEYPEKFDEDRRKVKLQGEAYFDVAPDSSKPFVIEAREATITVLGTAFNVKAHEQDMAVEVLVEEGIVRLANPDNTEHVDLHVGEKGLYIRENQEVKKETDLDPESLYWLNKTLLFRDTKLSTVFETLERLYEVNIRAENDTILNCTLTAKFRNEDVDHIISHIATIYDLQVDRDDDNFLISGNGCP